MNDIQINKLNEVFYQFQCDEESIYLELYNYFKVKVPGAEHSRLFKDRLWDGYISFFNSRAKTFPIGLFSYFQKFCKEYGYQYSFTQKDFETYDQLTDDQLETFYKELFTGTKFTPHYYQKDLIKTALNEKRGILLSSTSSGKSIVQYVIARWLIKNRKRVLIIVPNIVLVTQLFKDFIDYGWNETDKYTSRLFGGQDPDFKKPILISTFHSLKKPDSFFEKYDAILVDEVQFQKTDSLQKISKLCVNASFRIGLTGTLERDNLCDLYNIYGYLGPILKTITTQELTDKGYLTKAFIRNIVINYPLSFIKNVKYADFDTEKKSVYSNPERNKALSFIFNHISDNQNSLILVNEIDHLNFVKQYLESNFSDKYKLVIIHGKVKPEMRETIRELMKKERNVILLATFGCVAIGVNIPSIENIVLFSSSKSMIRVLQSIGRGLRLNKDKNKVVIWDVIDSLRFKTRNGNIISNFLYDHWNGKVNWDGKYKKGRINYYKETGFEYKILEKRLEDL